MFLQLPINSMYLPCPPLVNPSYLSLKLLISTLKIVNQSSTNLVKFCVLTFGLPNAPIARRKWLIIKSALSTILRDGETRFESLVSILTNPQSQWWNMWRIWSGISLSTSNRQGPHVLRTMVCGILLNSSSSTLKARSLTWGGFQFHPFLKALRLYFREEN